MFNTIDTGHPWVGEMERAVLLRSYGGKRIRDGDLLRPGWAFFVPNQFPPFLMRDKIAGEGVIANQYLKLIQDATQIRVYEDKLAQHQLWGDFMPRTWVAHTWESALHLLDRVEFPVVSKASVGSASLNVRLLMNKAAGLSEIERVFNEGVPIRRGPGPDHLQQGYVLWQEFISHDVTWRVTAIGSRRHVYQRFNYPDRPMAAPSGVVQTKPVEMSDDVESLLEFSNAFFSHAKTKWCAVDVLKSNGWKLLETSLAWARGDDPAGNAYFYGTKRSLNTQFDLLLDELEAW